MVLKNTVNKLWSYTVAEKTKTVYMTGYKHFENFLLLNGVQFYNGKLPPIPEELLIYFVGHCFGNTILYN